MLFSSVPAENTNYPDKDEQNLQAILKQLESHAAPYDDAFRTEKTQLTRLLLPVLYSVTEMSADLPNV